MLPSELGEGLSSGSFPCLDVFSACYEHALLKYTRSILCFLLKSYSPSCLNQESCNRLHRAPTGPPRFVTQSPAVAGFLLLNGLVEGRLLLFAFV